MNLIDCELRLNKTVEKSRENTLRHQANKDIRGDKHIQEFSFSSF